MLTEEQINKIGTYTELLSDKRYYAIEGAELESLKMKAKEAVCLEKADRGQQLFLNATDERLAKYLKKADESIFDGFHPLAVRMVIKADDYYLGTRADHFVLLFGYTESIGDGETCVVCISNHKGSAIISCFTFI